MYFTKTPYPQSLNTQITKPFTLIPLILHISCKLSISKISPPLSLTHAHAWCPVDEHVKNSSTDQTTVAHRSVLNGIGTAKIFSGMSDRKNWQQ